MTFDEPNISVGSKSPDENFQSIKSYLSSQADSLNYLVARLEKVESELTKLKEREE